MKEFLLIASVSISLIAGILLFTGAILYPLGVWECNSRWSNSGFQSEYGFPEGCRISKDGKLWIPEKNYREIAD